MNSWLFHKNCLYLLILLIGREALAVDNFTAVSAGDMTSSSAILWTQWSNASTSVSGSLEISTDAGFSSSQTASYATASENGNTAKVAISGLIANTAYYYRFSNGGTTSDVGKFHTNPTGSSITPYKIAFTGDYDALYRPYSVLAGFGTASNPGSSNVKAIINLGDLMYERDALGSAAVPSLKPNSSASNVDGATSAYYRKYLEGISGVDANGAMSASGNQGMKTMLATAGVYTLIDNHELNGAMISGGAAQTSLKENLDMTQAVNTTGSYINQTDAFRMMSKTFFDTHATAAQINGSATDGYTFSNLQLSDQSVVAPSDTRSNGTAQNYFTRSWGGAATYIQLDDRSYRDARMGDDNVSLASQVANNPDRTMLGKTQLDWFKNQLLAAKASGSVWTVISVSTPIDQWDPNDNKSWLAGYNYERNNLMKFIAENNMKNVVFLTTDDHMNRVTQLKYQPDPINQPNVWRDVEGAFQVLSAPAGAGGPYQNAIGKGYDNTTDYSIARSRQVLSNQALKQPNTVAMGVGLMTMPGLANVYREGGTQGGSNASAIDFFAATQFSYATLDWDRFANLRVKYWGIDAYAPAVAAGTPDPGYYPSTTPTPRELMSFSIHVPYTVASGVKESLTDTDFTDPDQPSRINRLFNSRWTVNGTLDLGGLGGNVSFNGFSGSGNIDLGANSLKMTNATDDFSGVISGTGGVMLQGGRLRLSGVNTYSGATQVDAGANLVIATAAALGSGQLNLVGSATVPATLTMENSMTISNPITVSGDPVFSVASGATATISGVISDGTQAGDVVVDGGGTLALSAVNTYTGPTQINQGSTLALTGNGSIAQSNAVTNNGILNVSQTSASNINLVGSFTQTATGTLIMDGSRQSMSIGGPANLSGALSLVNLTNSYTLGQRVSLISATGGLAGGFSYVSTNLGTASWAEVTPAGLNWVYGPSPSATLQAVQSNTQAIGTVVNQQLGALEAGLSYDCVKYDQDNLCISVGGRYTYAGSGPSGNAQAGLVIVGYRPIPTTRLGVFVDQSANITTPGNITQSKTSPMWGLFGHWNMNKDGNGLSFEGNAAFASSSLSISRSSSYSTEAGQGTTRFDGQAFQVQANYAQPVTDSVKAIPYLGLRYTRVGLGAYSENDSSQVIAPISYNSTTQNTFSVVTGIGLSSLLAEKLSGMVSAGLQQNLYYSMGNYSGSSAIPGLETFSVQMPNYKNSMATASAGLFYDVKKNERLAFNLLWQQQAIINSNTTSAVVTYTIGF